MKKAFITGLIIFLLALVFFSCSTDETCRRDRYVKMNVYFYNDSIRNIYGDTVSYKITIDSVTAKGLGKDSILFNNVKNLGQIALPLDQFNEVSKFIITANTVADTLTLYYKNKYEFISLECGNIRTHVIDSAKITGHYFYNVSVFNPEVNTLNAENIKLYHFK